MIEKWPIFKEVFRRGQVAGREAARKHYETKRASYNNPLVVAPTMEMAKHVCNLFNLPTHRHAFPATKHDHLRGLGPDTVFLFYYDAPWDLEIYRQVRATIEASQGLVIMVPELQLAKRPVEGRSW